MEESKRPEPWNDEKICNGGRLRRIVDKPVKIVVVLLYGVLDLSLIHI